MAIEKYQIGQKLWYAPKEQRLRPFEVEIIKIGGRWLYLNNRLYLNNSIRANSETLVVDGGEYPAPGKCYVSKEAREAELALFLAWDAFQVNVRKNYAVPKGMTLETIAKASEMLNL